MRELTTSLLVAVAIRSDTGSPNRLDLIQSLVPINFVMSWVFIDVNINYTNVKNNITKNGKSNIQNYYIFKKNKISAPLGKDVVHCRSP